MRRSAQGFTLLELIIIVVIILLVAAIALPNLLRSRISANEAAAVSSVGSINRAEVNYQTTYPTLGFATTLSALGPGPACAKPTAAQACLVESALAAATSPSRSRGGYWFALSGTGKDSAGVVNGYVVGGSAAAFNQSGVRDFCSVEDGVFHFRVPNGPSQPVNSGPECTAMPILH